MIRLQSHALGCPPHLQATSCGEPQYPATAMPALGMPLASPNWEPPFGEPQSLPLPWKTPATLGRESHLGTPHSHTPEDCSLQL